MNIAITSGLQLMPPEFSAGLKVWSRGNGLSADPTWATATNAVIEPSDPDFGRCLEIIKTDSTTRLRFVGETPIIAGVYLRISARVKMVAGPMCGVRIAGWAGNGARAHVAGVVEAGPTRTLTRYGEVVEVSAIVGTGYRSGVTMSWGTGAVFGHFGLDLVGGNGGAVRIDSIRIEDVTSAFVPAMIDWVDVRDFGARGDGKTDDRAAFVAADRAARGGTILVPEGEYLIGSSLSVTHPIRFKGKLKAAASTRIVFMQSFDFPTYADAFGNDTLGFKKALQALFGYTDHVALDLRGRRVDLTEPIKLHEVCPGMTGWSNRRVICNGQILAVPGPAWTTGKSSSTATYSTAAPHVLTNVVDVAKVEIGSRVIGPGVGREVYVRGRDIAKKTLTLSQALYGGSGTRSYTFERYRYMLDFSGMALLDRVNFTDIEFSCDGVCSGIMLPPNGQMIAVRDCYMLRPKDRGITSIGRGCQDLLVDRCQFLSNESDLLAQNRRTIAINVNANDAKIRDNRFVRFCHFMVAYGGGHIISGNHWFQGDSASGGLRFAGLVLTLSNVQTTITGNYIDNSSIEWTNEHSALPHFTGKEYSFGGLTVTGNTFLCSNTVAWFTWLTIKPHGRGHFIQGLNVSGNAFKALSGNVDRIDRVDTSLADLDYNMMRNVQFEGNTFNGVNTYVANPLRITHKQATAAAVWTLPELRGLPFRGWAKVAQSLVAETAITDAAGATLAEMPWVRARAGTSQRQLQVNWKTPAKGQVAVWARMDSPH